MAGDYLTMESEDVKSIFTAIDQAQNALRSAETHISSRTLQTLRDTQQIPFTVISERIILYPESAIRETLIKNYRPTYHPQ